MLELLGTFDLTEAWAVLRPLLLPFLTGTLTPVLCRRAFWPLLCWTGRGLQSAGRKIAAALRSKPNPQMAAMQATMERLDLMQATLERLARAWDPQPGSIPEPLSHANLLEGKAAPPPSKAGPW